MAIKSFKEIVDNKGYRISKKDREIFEEGTLQSFFGFSNSDIIEFIAYDVNDNQLPLQLSKAGDMGMVKYIPLTTENIRNYFLIAEGTLLQVGNFPKEYFIDVKQILNECGYDAGIFKTQVTLLNSRVGDYRENVNAKLWIKEISPSRTEIKVLPQRNEVADASDLLSRYNLFYNDGEFRDDTLPYVSQFVGTINASFVKDFIRNTYSEKWLNKLASEFGIKSFDLFLTDIHSKFVKAVNNEFSNKISDINDLNFGKNKSSQPPLQLSVDEIENTCIRILTQIIDKYLPQRKIQQTQVDVELDTSVDRVSKILQRRESDVIIKSKDPDINVTIEKEGTIKDVKKYTKIDDIIKRTIPDLDEPIEFVDSNPIKKADIVEEPLIQTPTGGSGGGGGRGSFSREIKPNDRIDGGSNSYYSEPVNVENYK
jgi:hypothetical protein